MAGLYVPEAADVLGDGRDLHGERMICRRQRGEQPFDIALVLGDQRALGTPLALRSELFGALESAGWRVEIAERCPARMAPTPHGEVIDAGIDTIPEVETTAEWMLIEAVSA